MIEFLWTRPPAEVETIATLLLAHGAGAPMDSGFMERFAGHAARRGLAVARFEFGYMASRRVGGAKRPPPRADRLVGEYQNAVQAVLSTTETPLIIGGKSMGGRVAAMFAGAGSLPKRVAGVVCLGYPFHPTGKAEPQHWRMTPLAESRRPILIAQGVRDPFGSQTEIAVTSLPGRVTLTWLEDGNHDLAPRGASPATWDGNLAHAAEAVASFAQATIGATA